jgi:hypothetical protein
MKTDTETGEITVMSSEDSMVAMMNKKEIDQQIATAKKYPRSVSTFRKDAMSMVTLNERIAESCIYALPRGSKTIEGASARLAEIIVSCWGNSRAGARIVNETDDFIVAQAVFHDLERNVCLTYEVQRRITDKNGRKFQADMIGVTANAACSIALRNAILKGVPKAFWDDIYEKAREVVRGDFATLANRRADIFAKCQGFGINKDQIFELLEIGGEADVTLDHIVTLRGLLTAIRDGDTTPEQAFPASLQPKTVKKELKACTGEEFAAQKGKWKKAVEAGKKTTDELIAIVTTSVLLSEEQKTEIQTWKKEGEK